MFSQFVERESRLHFDYLKSKNPSLPTEECELRISQRTHCDFRHKKCRLFVQLQQFNSSSSFPLIGALELEKS